MKKYILGAILSFGILSYPAFANATGLTAQQATTLIQVVQASPGTPASAFVSLITAFSNLNVNQASSLITVVQSSPGTAASIFVPLITSFTDNSSANQSTNNQQTTNTTAATNGTTAADTSFQISFPSENSTLIAGQTYTTSWAAGTNNRLNSYRVDLMSPNGGSTNLGTAYQSQGQFSFTIPNNAVPSAGYKLYFNGPAFGEYSRMFTVQNSTASPTITITWPQAGYSLENSGAKDSGLIGRITWTSANLGGDTIGIALFYASGANNGQVAKYIAQNVANTGSFNWAYDSSLPNGNYSISVYDYRLGIQRVNSTASSGVFAITSSPVSTGVTAPTVTLTSAASSVTSGQATTLEWHVSPTTATCSLSATGLGTIYSDVYWKDITNWGTPTMTTSTTYTLSCTNSGGTTSRSRSIAVYAPTQTNTTTNNTATVSASAPTVTLTANPTTITAGQSSTLTLSSSDANYCSVSNVDWSSSRTNGSTNVSPTQTTTYTATCTGSGGSTSRNVMVTVNAAVTTTNSATVSAPTVTLTSAASSVTSGQATTLEWHVSPTTATCSLSATGLGTIYSDVYWKDITNWGTPTMTTGTTYTLSCTNSGGTTSRSRSISVAAAAAVVGCSANGALFKNGTTRESDGVRSQCISSDYTWQSPSYLGSGTYPAGYCAYGSYNYSNDTLAALGSQCYNCSVGSWVPITSSYCGNLISSLSPSSQTASALNAFSSAAGLSSMQENATFSYKWNRDLQVGSPYIEDIRALQTALALQGLYFGEITGGFYSQTFTAVKAFQQKYGIEQTGFVGPATRAKLNALY